jgi:hypothetical protein
MAFVYLHIIWSGRWIGFGVEKYRFGLLTNDRFTRGDLPVDLRDDQTEPGGRQALGPSRRAVEDGAG